MQNALILKTAVFAGEGKQPEMFKGFEILTLCGNNTHHADLFSLQNYEFSKSSRAFFASQIPWSANLSRASFGSSGCPFSAAFLYHLTASS